MIPNRKYNCLVIDDEFLARKLLTEYISKVPQLNLIGSLDSSVDAIDFISGGVVDILFIDIEMSDISGIDFIRNLSLANRPIVIFVTAYPQYAVQGFEVDATEYLIKPATFSRFIKAVNKAVNILNVKERINSLEKNRQQLSPSSITRPNNYIIVKTERKIIKLLYDDIYFIEGAMEYVNFQTKDKKIMALFSLKQLEEELPKEKFMRIHRSYIVALDKIREIDGNQVRIGEWKVYVSKDNKSRLIQLFRGSERFD